MNFNYLNLLLAISPALDHVEHDLTGVTQSHSKRVAFLTLSMGRAKELPQGKLLDLMICALLHDGGLTQYVQSQYHGSYLKAAQQCENMELHCTIGEDYLKSIPFSDTVAGAVLYHHENADGTGPFEKEALQVCDFAKWIHFADQLDSAFDLSIVTPDKYESVCRFLQSERGKMFDETTIDLFLQLFPFEKMAELRDERLDQILYEAASYGEKECTPEQLMQFAKVLAMITDYRSRYTRQHSVGVADKAFIMGIYYGATQEEAARLYIAGALHDIGTLVIDKDILEKPDRLTHREYQYVQSHAYEVYKMLAAVPELEDITRWASRHHEKLDGSGYPFGLKADQLDRWDRLIACLDVYQALIEKRAYKERANHAKAMDALMQMAQNGQLDQKICEDIGNVFQS